MTDRFTPDEQKIIQKYEQMERGRDRVIEQLGEDFTGTLKSKVAWLLNQFPETRNSDKDLTIKFIEEFYPELVSAGKISLDALHQVPAFRDIARARQLIQGTFQLFLPTDPAILGKRKQLEDELREQYGSIAREQEVKRVHVYIDESGKTDPTLFVGSVWVYGTETEVQRLIFEILRYRELEEYSREWKFAELSKNEVPIYKGLVDLLLEHSGNLSFKFASIPRSGYSGETNRLVTELTEDLLVLGIEEEDKTRRAPLPRHISVTFDPVNNFIGADDVLKSKRIAEKLATANQEKFGHQLSFSKPQPMDSKSNQLLQVADLFAASASRLKNHPQEHHKTEFARYFLGKFSLQTPGDQKEIRSDIGSHIQYFD